jgi:hypothetical protein
MKEFVGSEILTEVTIKSSPLDCNAMEFGVIPTSGNYTASEHTRLYSSME